MLLQNLFHFIMVVLLNVCFWVTVASGLEVMHSLKIKKLNSGSYEGSAFLRMKKGQYLRHETKAMDIDFNNRFFLIIDKKVFEIRFV